MTDLFGPGNKYFVIKYKLKTHVEKCIINNVFFLKKNIDPSFKKATSECA